MALQALVLYSAKTAGNSMDLMEVKLTSSGMKPPETRAVHLKVVELGPGGGGGGVLPYMGHIGTCRGIGYGAGLLEVMIPFNELECNLS